MRYRMGWLIRLIFSSGMLLAAPSMGHAQSSPEPSGKSRSRAEFAGIAGGSGLLAIDGGTAADGMWSLKFGVSGRGRLGFEGSFEQSLREPSLRYFGGDLLYHFLKKDRKRPVPFLHVGAGSLVWDGRALGALSFGGGIKQYLNDRIALRFGVQDRMSLKQPEFHRLDFYGGIVIRF